LRCSCFTVRRYRHCLFLNYDRITLSYQAEWEDDDTKQRCRVFYRSLSECAAILYQRVSDSGRVGDVFTMKEVRAELPASFNEALDDYAISKVVAKVVRPHCRSAGVQLTFHSFCNLEQVLSLMEDDGRARTFERGVSMGCSCALVLLVLRQVWLSISRFGARFTGTCWSDIFCCGKCNMTQPVLDVLLNGRHESQSSLFVL